MKKYIAKFSINHGVSNGFGIKYPDNIEKDFEFEANNDNEAYNESIYQARLFGEDYLSNPETYETKVVLKSLKDNDWKKVSLEKKLCEISVSMIEHVTNSHYEKNEFLKLKGLI